MTTLASRKNGLSVCWPVGTPSAPGGHGKYEIKSVCVFFLHCLTICANIYPSLTDAPQPQLLLHWSLTSSSAKTKKHRTHVVACTLTHNFPTYFAPVFAALSFSSFLLFSVVIHCVIDTFSFFFNLLYTELFHLCHLHSFIPMSNACCRDDKEPWVELIDLNYYHNIFYYIHAFANKSLLSYV